MPELPDVEIFRRYFQSTALHQSVASIKVPAPDMLQSLTAAELGRKLHAASFASVSRRGKYLFAEVVQQGWLVLHFGMSGFLKYHKRPEETPEHARLVIQFDNGYQLVFDCQRKFGGIFWADTVEKFVEEKELGLDPLQEPFEADEFFRILRDRRGYIKSLLMNQQVLAGLGNIYSDEILFQAGIHPRRKVSSLKKGECREVHRKILSVLQEAIDCRVGETGWPDDWLLPRRKVDASCPRCEGRIERLKISGRRAYFCNTHQR